jgi:hypothetical protein
MRGIVLVVACLIGPGSAVAQGFGPCASIADPRARLECYDRQGAAGAPRQAPPQPLAQSPPPPAAQGGCTRASPCTGPRGGRYYYSPSGAKRYL